MRNSGVGIRLLVPILTLAIDTLDAQGTKLVEITDKTRGVSISVPADWDLGAIKKRDLGTETWKLYNVVSFDATESGGENMVLDVWVFNTRSYNVLALASQWVDEDAIRFGSQRGVIHTTPLVYSVAPANKSGSKLFVRSYRRTVGRTVGITLQCKSMDWESIKPHYLALLKTHRVNLSPWPKRPTGRHEKLSAGILFSADDSVEKKEMREIQKCALDAQKAIASLHGPIDRPEEEPLRVYVHKLMADHKKIAESDDVRAVVGEPDEHRLFTIPFGPRGSADRRHFVQEVCIAFMHEIYATEKCDWMPVGEAMVAGQRDATKKKLPWADQRMLAEMSTIAIRFDELQAKKHSPTMVYWLQCYAYVALFQAGPSKYRQAYRAFLTDLRKTGHAAAAAKKHLLSLDQVQMIKDVRAYVGKLRPVRLRVR